MTVLVPMLVRPNLPQTIRDGLRRRIGRLFLPFGSRVTWDVEEWLPAYEGENYWGRFARMRQAAIDGGLQPGDTWVLWIDADIVNFPDRLFYALRDTTAVGAVVSPLVKIEGMETNYDTAGTRPSFGDRSPSTPPAPGKYEMYAVGGCVLVPADVHRRYRFRAQADDDDTDNTEWTSICEGARALGYKVWWNTNIVVEHADLEALGEGWH